MAPLWFTTGHLPGTHRPTTCTRTRATRGSYGVTAGRPLVTAYPADER